MTPEVEQLRATLDGLRAAVLKKVAGMSEPDARRSTVDSGTNPVTRNGRARNPRWALLAVIEETARHAGHADIIREQIDGQTGR